MAFAWRGRKIGSIPYVSGQVQSLDIPRDGVVTNYYLRAKFTFNSDTDAAAVGPLFQTLARLMRRITVQIGGRDTVLDISGEMAALRALYEFGTPANGMSDSIILTKDVSTVYDVVVPIARIIPRGRRPDDTGDDLRNVSQAVMSVQWGLASGADIFTTPGAAAAIESVTLDVFADYLMVPKGDPAKFLIRDLRSITAQPTATNTAYGQIIDGRSGYFVKSIAIAALDDNVGSNSILNNIQVNQGAYTLLDVAGKMLQGRNKLTYGIETVPAGAFMIDFTMLGELTQAVNTDPQKVVADLQLVQDITFQSTVTSLLYSIESIRQPAWM